MANNNPLHVEILDRSNDESYLRFLGRLGRTTPAVLAYHHCMYRDLLCRLDVGEPLYLGAFADGDLVAVLPGFVRRTSTGTVYSSLPFFGPNAGVLSDPEWSELAHRELLGAVRRIMEREPAALTASVYTPLMFDEFGMYERALPDAIAVDKTTQVLFLPDAAWSREILYDLRKAERAGVTVESDVTEERIARLYEIYEQNCADRGIPKKAEACVRYLGTEGVKSGHVGAQFAYYRGEMIAGLLMLWGPQTASYYLPCNVDESRSLQAGTLLVDCAVGAARQRGIRYWNWEASPAQDEGVYRFKSKWGSKPVGYKVFIQRFCQEERLCEIGVARLAAEFPYFFVFPFERLERLERRFERVVPSA